MAIGRTGASRRWAIVVCGLLVLTAVSSLIVDPITQRIRFSLMPNEQRDQSSGVVRLLRGLQMSLADICYAKSTHYQHRGILYTFADEDILGTEINKERVKSSDGTEGTTSTAAATQPRDSLTTEGETRQAPKDITLIPTKDHDFRGIIGNVEREVKPFDPTHVEHTKPMEALPWLRLATWINPEHENAWIATAFWLKGTDRKDRRATSQAIQLLERAMAVNQPQPGRVWDKQGLAYMLAHLYLIEADDPDKAMSVLEPVLKRGEEDFARLNDTERDWLEYNFRDAAQAYKKSGRHDKAIENCKLGIALFPTSKPLHLTLRREQQMLEKTSGQKNSGTKPAKSAR